MYCGTLFRVVFLDIGDKSVLSDALSDASVLEEVLRMILEIINSCLVAQIKNNPNLVMIPD
jgi:hypothetical protein